MMRFSSALLWVAFLLATPGSAVADDRAEAKRLKDLGTTALNTGDYATALEHFEHAYRAFPSPNLKFNLGLVFAKQGRKIEAATAFRSFVDEATNVPSDAMQHAKATLAELERELARLNVGSNIEGTELFLDERSVGRLPMFAPIYAWPGTHKIRGSFSGYESASIDFSVDAGAERTIVLKLVPVVVAPAVVAAPAPVPGQSSRVKIASVVLGGSGLAAIAVGVGLLGHYGAAYGSAQEGLDQFARARSLDGERIGGAVLVGVGGAMLVSGVVLYLVKKRASSR